ICAPFDAARATLRPNAKPVNTKVERVLPICWTPDARPRSVILERFCTSCANALHQFPWHEDWRGARFGRDRVPLVEGDVAIPLELRTACGLMLSRSRSNRGSWSGRF